MRGYFFAAQGGAALLGCHSIFRNQSFDCIPAKRSPTDAGKYRILVQVIAFSQPATQYCRSFFAKRCCALLSALSYALHVGTGSQYDVLPAKSNQFRNPQASLDGHDEKGSISAADPSRKVRCCDQSIDFFALEKLDKPTLIALVWYGEDALAEQRIISSTFSGSTEGTKAHEVAPQICGTTLQDGVAR